MKLWIDQNYSSFLFRIVVLFAEHVCVCALHESKRVSEKSAPFQRRKPVYISDFTGFEEGGDWAMYNTNVPFIVRIQVLYSS